MYGLPADTIKKEFRTKVCNSFICKLMQQFICCVYTNTAKKLNKFSSWSIGLMSPSHENAFEKRSTAKQNLESRRRKKGNSSLV